MSVRQEVLLPQQQHVFDPVVGHVCCLLQLLFSVDNFYACVKNIWAQRFNQPRDFEHLNIAFIFNAKNNTITNCHQCVRVCVQVISKVRISVRAGGENNARARTH